MNVCEIQVLAAVLGFASALPPGEAEVLKVSTGILLQLRM